MADISVIIDVLGVDDMVKATRAATRLENEYKQLDRQFNKGKISAQQYAKGIQQVDAKVESLIASHRQAQTTLDGYTKSVTRSSVATSSAAESARQLADAQRMSGKSTNKFGMVAQQVGYQVGDFFVQVQSGTSAMMAFGQQGTQLAGLIPGLAGAIIGIGLSAFTMLAGSIMRASENSEELGSQLDKISSGISDAASSTTKFSAELAKVNAELTRVKLEDTMFGVLADFRGPETFLENLIFGFQQLPGANLLFDTPEEAIKALGLDPSIITREFFKSFEQALQSGDISSLETQFQGLLDYINMQGGFDSLTMSGKQMVIELERMIAETESFNSKVEDSIWALENGGQAALNLADEIGRAGVEALALAGIELSNVTDAQVDAVKLGMEMGLSAEAAVKLASLDIAGGIGAAADVALDLSNRLGIAFENAAAIAALAASQSEVGLDAFGGSGEFKYSAPSKFIPPKRKSGSSGSSGSAVDNYQRAKDALDNLVGTYDEAQKKLNQVAQAQKVVNEAISQGVIDTQRGGEIMDEYKASLENLENPMQKLADVMRSSFSDAFMSIVDGTKSAKDAFKDMARAIIKQLFDILVVQQIVGSFDVKTGTGSGIVGAIAGLFFANGGAFQNGRQITAFANGGVVSSPTLFPMANGAGLMGEAGPEAIMPLKRGKNGKLGVQMEGNQGNVTVQNHFHIAANGDESVKRIIAQEAPKIANLTQKQILDQRRRGGVMKSTFG